jgi:class 3 adenylate cyclase
VSANLEQRKLAAIMFTDVVGYSALSQREGKLALVARMAFPEAL